VLLMREVGVMRWIVMDHAVEALLVILPHYWWGGLDRQVNVQQFWGV